MNGFESYTRGSRRPRGGRRVAAGSRGSRAGAGRVGARTQPGGQPAHRQCPPELRDAFTEARDFIAGLISTFGLAARLSYGGVEPARDGRQITIDVRGLRPSGAAGHDVGTEYEAADDLGVLIGKHGLTLDALTAVTNAVMHREDLEGIFFAVDVEGYRARRTALLRSIAQRSAERAAHAGIAVELSPMPPAERRIVHLALASHPDVATESTGIGAQRRVVIVPRGARQDARNGRFE